MKQSAEFAGLAIKRMGSTGIRASRVGGGTLSRTPLALRHSLDHKRKTAIPNRYYPLGCRACIRS